MDNQEFFRHYLATISFVFAFNENWILCNIISFLT